MCYTPFSLHIGIYKRGKKWIKKIECIVQKTKKIFEKSNKDYNIVQTKGVSE